MLNFLPGLFGAASSFLPQQGASMMNDPSVQAGFGSIDQTLAGMQGVADQFVNPAGQRGQSPAYMQGLTGGGTGAQNDRFSRLYDPSNVTADALASLAADPQFGHLFGGGPQASVQQFQAPQQAVPQITDDSISQMRNQGQLDGTSGVRLSPQLQSQALQNRLDQRADSAAALENMRVGPMDFVNPLDRMAAAYEWEAMNREFQAQQEKNLIAKTLAQAEIDARNASLSQDASQFDRNMDFREMQARMQGQASSAQNAFTQDMERQKLGLLERELGMQEAAAAREGQLGWKDMFNLVFGDAALAVGGPEAMMGLLSRFNVPMQEGVTLPALGGAAPVAGAPTVRRPTPAQSEAWGAMPLEQQVIAMQDAGWTEDQILARLQQTQPGGFGITLDNPDGSSAAWEMARAFPGLPMFYDDAFFGSGFQKAIFGGDPGLQRQEFLAKFGQKPAAPAPAAASLPPLQFFPPVSAF